MKKNIANKIVCKHDGSDAVSYLEEIDPAAFPDLIIVDYEMPELNGLEFLQEYENRFYQDHPDTRIIFSSIHELQGMLKELPPLKCISSCLQKPISVDQWRSF